MRFALVFAALLLAWPLPARAEWQLRPFIGVTFGGSTTLVGDLEQAVGKPNVILGVTGGLVGEVFGIEADLGRAPGFFQSGGTGLVLRSNVTTLTGNVTMALPRRMTEYTLRPYIVGGGGLMRPRTNTFGRVFEIAGSMAAVDLGAGVTGFVTRRVGVNWDVRRFRSVRGRSQSLTLGGAEQLSFWRVNTALAIRY